MTYVKLIRWKSTLRVVPVTRQKNNRTRAGSFVIKKISGSFGGVIDEIVTVKRGGREFYREIVRYTIELITNDKMIQELINLIENRF